jgi:hypothetical protein
VDVFEADDGVPRIVANLKLELRRNTCLVARAQWLQRESLRRDQHAAWHMLGRRRGLWLHMLVVFMVV